MENNMFVKRLLVFALAASVTGCAQAGGTASPAQTELPETAPAETEPAAAVPSAEPDYTTGTPWLCSFLDGNVTEDTPVPDLKDDFYLACNKEALQNLKIPDGYISYGSQAEVAIQLDEDIKNLFTSGGQAESHDMQLALNLYSLLADWDSRNEIGVTPLKKLTDTVEEIDSLDAMTQYLAQTPQEDRLYDLFGIFYMEDLDDSSTYILIVYPGELLLNDSAEYQELTPIGQITKDAKSLFSKRMLMKLGYTEDEALSKIENCLAFETGLAGAMATATEKQTPEYIQMINNHYTRKELSEVQDKLPVLDAAENGFGFPKADSYLVEEPKWLETLNSLYTEENLEQIKDYLIVHGAERYSDVLDRECYDWFQECDRTIKGVSGSKPDEILLSQQVKGLLAWPVARLYCEKYLSQEDKDRVSGLIDEIISEYHEIINEANFLSDTTKAGAIEKLDSMNKKVLWPDDWTAYEFTELKIPSAEEGGTLLEAIWALMKYTAKRNAAIYAKPVDKNLWQMTSTEFNCAYNFFSNSIEILGGFARGSIYNAEMSDEELYANIGIVIGHEISHAFDSSGAQFDKDGNMNLWWTEEDWAAFQEKNQKIVEYYGNIHPWEGQDYYPESKGGEACADMGGIKCMLKLAAKKEHFDYDRFFRSYAHLWLSKGTLNMTYLYFTNEHPLAYLRVNCTLQQFDEFLDFYGITEGDGMYLAPEDRIAIW